MADYQDVTVDAHVWTSLHDELGITSGTQIFFQNIGIRTLRVVLAATSPSADDRFGLKVPHFDGGEPVSDLVQSTPIGAGDETWVIGEGGNTTVSVQDAT
ncbi:MAG: hypothetical protein COB09_17150 [Thalassobium sp.]|nr:MAG: hypothetical protein COB09_17150 [Thalassobium sp.]